MSIDSILRAIGVFTCIYTIGLFVTVTSSAALNAVALNAGAFCTAPACPMTSVVAQHHVEPTSMTVPHAIHTAALFLAGGR